MSSIPASTLRLHTETPAGSPPEVSLLRLYLLRLAYLLLAAGLAVVIWPVVLHHTSELAVRRGAQLSLLAGIGAIAALGLRYPIQMLPVLLFELTWKAIYLIAFALPLWRAHQIDAATADEISAILWVVIFLPLIPWRYVWRHFVIRPGDRWK